MTVRVSQTDLQGSARLSLKWLRQVARQPFATLGYSRDCELSLTLTDDQRIHELNRDYRQKDQPTDVLSFATLDNPESAASFPVELPLPLGDIIISLDTVKRQAQENSVQTDAELAWVLIHGVLHLLGYDHQTPTERDVMRALEVQSLSSLGIAKQVLV